MTITGQKKKHKKTESSQLGNDFKKVFSKTPSIISNVILFLCNNIHNGIKSNIH